MNTLPRRCTLSVLLLALAFLLAPTSTAVTLAAEPAVADNADAPIVLDDDLEELRRRFESEIQELRDEFRRELERAQSSDERAEMRAARERIAQLERENAELRRAMRALRAGGDAAGGVVIARPVEGADDAPTSDRPRGQLGVRLGPTEPGLATALGVSPEDTFQILGVQEGSAAERMRLRAGDVILAFDGKPGNVDAFIEHMTPKRSGDELVLTYARLQSSGEVLRITGRTQLLPWREPAPDAGEGTTSVPAIRLEPAPPPPIEAPATGGPITLGITVEETDAGVVVTGVTDGGNLAAARIASGDRITSFAGRTIGSIDNLLAARETVRGGQELAIEFVRGGETWTSRIRLARGDRRAEHLSGPERVGGASSGRSEGRGFLGVVPEEQGNALVLTEVVPGSAAQTMGLQAGDRLVNVNGDRVRTLDALREVLGGLRAGDEVRIVYRRDGARRVAEGTLGAVPDDDQSSASPSGSASVATASGSASSSGVTRAASPGRTASGSGSSSSSSTASSSSGSSSSGSSSSSSSSSGERTEREIPPARHATLGIVAELTDGQVVITEFAEASPTAAAGARVGDRVTRIEGSPVAGFETIIDTLGRRAPGDRIAVTVERDGRPIDLRVTLVARIVEPTSSTSTTSSEPTASITPATAPVARPHLGVEVEERPDGVWVVAVDSASPARAAGLRAGDRILTVGDRDVIDLDTMRSAVLDLPLESATRFTVLRGGRTTPLDVTPARR